MSFTKNEMQMIEGALDFFIQKGNSLKEDMSNYNALLSKVQKETKETGYGSRENN